jgi:hypothetical protein
MASSRLTVVKDRSPPDIVLGVLYCLGPTMGWPSGVICICRLFSLTWAHQHDDKQMTNLDQHLVVRVVKSDFAFEVTIGHRGRKGASGGD